MDFIRELLEAEKDGKKKKKRTAAAQTYHRDYIRTKKKPYRKYHPDTEATNEAMEIELSGGEEGNDEVDHGAIMAELERIIGELSELLTKYDEFKGGEEGADYEEDFGQEMGPEEQPTEEPAEEPEPQPKFSPQFSSWLQKTSGVTLNEIGAIGMVHPKSVVVGRSVKHTDYKKEAGERVKHLASKFGPGSTIPGALETFKQLTGKHGGKHGDRIYKIVTNHISKQQ